MGDEVIKANTPNDCVGKVPGIVQGHFSVQKCMSSLHAKCPLLLPDFNQNGNLSIYFNTTPQYKTELNSAQ
jgi:hypothetical protein